MSCLKRIRKLHQSERIINPATNTCTHTHPKTGIVTYSRSFVSTSWDNKTTRGRTKRRKANVSLRSANDNFPAVKKWCAMQRPKYLALTFGGVAPKTCVFLKRHKNASEMNMMSESSHIFEMREPLPLSGTILGIIRYFGFPRSCMRFDWWTMLRRNILLDKCVVFVLKFNIHWNSVRILKRPRQIGKENASIHCISVIISL